MISAYRSFFKGYADFSGRSTRSEFWWVWLVNVLLFLPVYYLLFSELGASGSTLAVAIISVYIILFIIGVVPFFALIVRRLRDANFHWAFIFLMFAPFGGLVLLVLLATPSKTAEDLASK